MNSNDSSSEDIFTAVPLKSVLSTAQSTPNIILPTVSSSAVTQDNKIQIVKRGHDLEDHGDLDPQTGMFYVDKNNSDLVTKEVVIVKSNSSSSVDSGKNYDLLSSSLAHAQIDLDPFQFIDETQVGTKIVEGETIVQPSETTIIDSPSIGAFLPL